jgi:hypothetical protein
MVSGKLMKWLAISLYAALLLFVWLDYFLKLTGYATLEGALLYSILAPTITYAGFQIYRIARLKFWQALWTVFGACVFGFAIYAAITFLLNRILSLSALADSSIVLLTYVALSYVVGAYLGYRFGKRRRFMPITL